jgi:cardiolipin synthase
VLQASALFEHDWAFARGRKALDANEAPPAALAPAARAQLVASGPDQVDDTVHALLVTAAYRARSRIQLVTPYFVPDASLLMALCLAARRGVAVDLLLPARSNHRLSDVARRRALRALHAAGARLWLTPHMQHAKLAVIDDVVAFTGSTNLDSRSLFLNYELMFAFHDADAIAACAEWFERERLPATRHEPSKAGLLTDLAEGLVLWVGFQL